MVRENAINAHFVQLFNIVFVDRVDIHLKSPFMSVFDQFFSHKVHGEVSGIGVKILRKLTVLTDSWH